jgi:hypothetical protein
MRTLIRWRRSCNSFDVGVGIALVLLSVSLCVGLSEILSFALPNAASETKRMLRPAIRRHTKSIPKKLTAIAIRIRDRVAWAPVLS